MQKILIISFSVIHSDPRVMRQIRLLENRFHITVAGFGCKPDAAVEFIDLTRSLAVRATRAWWGVKLLLGFFESYYWNRIEVRSAQDKIKPQVFDLIVANDIAALPLALRLADGKPVLMDAHEYSPREFDDKWMWRILFGRYHHDLCRRYLSKASGMLTVCQGIADEYARHYGVAPEVVHNAPLDQKLAPSPVRTGRVRLIHHGAAIHSRRLETMIEVMSHLDERFTLDFMLVESDAAYMNDLRRRASADERIRFIPAVPMSEICAALNGYDMGIYLLPPVNFNHEHALPNKFFEFIQARLAVAIGPSPEMSRIVKAFGCGVVADSFKPANLAAAISAVSESDLIRYKSAANAAAAEVNYEAGGKVLFQSVERLLAQAPHSL
ncbi:glycosyltransferase [Azonexus sp.]|uniref:glycosyltransferase n=1 Tax=Azonexus sp. TaxID=1872668 RepID=UPI0028252A0F|nr:glycosyltransferase [Azonexus sp.]MDR1995919.1 glycosyltransferase [Azonexus sp.]